MKKPCPKTISGKKVKVDFDAPDLSSNGGLLFASVSNCSFIDKLSDCIPDCRNTFFYPTMLEFAPYTRLADYSLKSLSGHSIKIASTYRHELWDGALTLAIRNLYELYRLNVERITLFGGYRISFL